MYHFKLLLMLQFVLQTIPTIHGEICSAGLACDMCITLSSHCGWCKAENYSGLRCSKIEKLIEAGCSNDSIEFPVNKLEITKNREMNAYTKHKSVQVKPQQIKLNLRPRKAETVTLYYRQAVDFPVDLYYLMDLSKTMFSHRERLADLGNKLANQMRSITKNFRIGFGSFIDKTIPPFTNNHQQVANQTCGECSPPYVFRHRMSLDKDIDKFMKYVRESPIAGNADKLEGLFDAVMQSIVCWSQIGWSHDARRILVVTTDADFHHAGDGRLAGLIRPNDENCHLDPNGFYIEGNAQDYPSINQINMVSQEHNVHIIFIVSQNHLTSYEKLVSKLRYASIAQLSDNSSNLVDIIERESRLSVSRVNLVANNSNFLSVTHSFVCSSSQKDPIVSNMQANHFCSDIEANAQVLYKIRIELLKCPKKGRQEIIKINPIELEDGLIVEVNMLCDCNCENEEVIRASQCNYNGSYSCGVCNCNLGRYGSRCECSANESHSIGQVNCYANRNDTIPCSGNGHCFCDQCLCNSTPEHRFSGKYCQCDDSRCPVYDNMPCGGPTKGVCECGRCICSDLYYGPDCSCQISNSTCVDPITGLTCNGRGECDCGSCSCYSTAYAGPYCETCIVCLSQCSFLEDLVEKHVNSGEVELTHLKNNRLIVSTLVDHLFVGREGERCEFIRQDGCAYSFTYNGLWSHSQTLNPNAYYQLNSRATITISRNRVCKQPINYRIVFLQYIGSVIMTGATTLLIWRLITFMIDRHEYYRFLYLCAKNDFSENNNPLFKPSTTKFENPVYGGD